MFDKLLKRTIWIVVLIVLINIANYAYKTATYSGRCEPQIVPPVVYIERECPVAEEKKCTWQDVPAIEVDETI